MVINYCKINWQKLNKSVDSNGKINFGFNFSVFATDNIFVLLAFAHTHTDMLYVIHKKYNNRKSTAKKNVSRKTRT